jgi:D-glycero-D-manno-heptose 1,7-bisphosphate phosphatase
MSRAAFLDRDGVLNELVWFEDAGIVDSPFHEDQVRLIEGAAEGVRLLRELDYRIIVVSNQPGVAKGRGTRAGVDRVTARLRDLLVEQGARVDAVYYCLHHPEALLPELRGACDCRKPKPGLLLTAAAEHGIDLHASIMVGDSITDVEAGAAAGCSTVLLGRIRCDLCRHLAARGVKPGAIHASLIETARELWNQEDRDHAALHRHG